MELDTHADTEPRPRAALLVAALVPALVYALLVLVIAWLVWEDFRTPLAWPGVLATVLVVGPLLLPAVLLFRRRSPWSFAFAVLVCVEFLCAWLAYHTIGAVTSGLLMLVLWLNAIPVALLLSETPRARRVGAGAALLLALLVIPYNGLLGWRWIWVHAEAERIVAYLERTVRETGDVPADLSRYSFDRPWTASYIDYTRYTIVSSQPPPPPLGHIRLTYSIGTPTTSHWYNPDGTWGYHPD